MTFPVYTAPETGRIARDGEPLIRFFFEDSRYGKPASTVADLDDLTQAIVERLNGVTLDREVATLLARVLDPKETTDKVDLVAVRHALNFALQDAPGDKQAAQRRLDAIPPEQAAAHDLDAALYQGASPTFSGSLYLAWTDRIGGLLIRAKADRREVYCQPGDDAERVIADLEAALDAAGVQGFEPDAVDRVLEAYF
jgi:hypothetical protein